jgi:hypothetical protein
MSSLVRICAVNFWDGFTLESGFLKYLFDQALGSFQVVLTQEEADIVLTTPVQPRRRRWYRPRPTGWISHPDKTIAVIRENQRPKYRWYRYSMSSDFDTYGGRNCRVPNWYTQLKWPGLTPDRRFRKPGDPHGFEPFVDIDSLLQPRSVTAADRELFCCFVCSNPEPYRIFCAERLSCIGRIDFFGKIAGKALEVSKYEILSRYRFNLCFENSIFPGYYTEKLLHAWVGGCIPLYYSDPWYAIDFNPKAALNKIHYRTVDEFVNKVAEIDASRDAMLEFSEQPLLLTRPSLDEAIEFLRKTCAEIMSGSRH